MAVLNGILALTAVLLFCTFLAKRFDLNAALLPLPVLSGIAVWLFLWGLMGQLKLGGALIYAAALAALGWLLYKKQTVDALQRLRTPGTVFFAAASFFFLVLFAVRQPLFIQWDEFTFWGSACRLTKLQNVLHPAAQGMLLARGYNPGLPLLSYFFQFFGSGFSEWSVYFALDTLFISTLSAMAAPLTAKRWPAAVLMLTGGALLPFFFTVPALGGVSNVYVSAMGDLFLGSVFGAALCLYLHSSKRPAGFVLVGVTLGFLTLIKDMGLAYSLIVIGTLCLDWLFRAGRPTLRRFAKTVGMGLVLAVPLPMMYLVWSRFVMAFTGQDKTTLGNAERPLSPVDMVVNGTLQLLGIQPTTERTGTVRQKMLASPFNIPVSLLGCGVLVLAVIGLVLIVCALALPKGEKHRPVLMGVVLGMGLLAFLVFHFFLYAFMFSEQEALQLKDYSRYIGPYYLGFWMFALGFLARALANGQMRMVTTISNMGLVLGVGILIGMRGTPAAGFLDYPKNLYGERQEIIRRAEEVNPLLHWSDDVLLIKQGDMGAGWNYYGYQLSANIANGFGGFGYGHKEDYNWPTTHMNIVSPEAAGPDKPEVYPYQTVCSTEDMYNFLKEKRYDYLLVDTPDAYFSEELASAFGLEGLPTERADHDFLIKVEYEGDAIRWSLVNGEAAQ